MAATNMFPDPDLKVLAELPKDERTSKIHETFVPLAKIPDAPKNQAGWEKLRDGWKKFLAEKVFAAWPAHPPGAKLELVSSAQTKPMRIHQFEFVSQENVSLPIYVVQSGDAKPKRLIVRVLDETDAKKFAAIFNSVAQKKALSPASVKILETELSAEKSPDVAIAYVLPRGIGPTAWTSDEKKATHIRRRFMLLGTTLDAMRVWDIRRAVEALGSNQEFQNVPIELRGTGEMGVNALYAALYAPAVKTVQLGELPSSHANGPDYLNVLKGLDIPQTVAMIAEKTSVKLFATDPALWQFPLEVSQNLDWKAFQIESVPSIESVESARKQAAR